jgi:hypothetical protein
MVVVGGTILLQGMMMVMMALGIERLLLEADARIGRAMAHRWRRHGLQRRHDTLLQLGGYISRP